MDQRVVDFTLLKHGLFKLEDLQYNARTNHTKAWVEGGVRAKGFIYHIFQTSDEECLFITISLGISVYPAHLSM